MSKYFLIFSFLLFYHVKLTNTSKHVIINLIIPSKSIQQYQSILSVYKQSIRIIEERKHVNELYSKWLILSDTLGVVRQLQKSNFNFKVFTPESRTKRFLLFQNFHSESNITSENLTKTYFSLDKIYQWMNEIKSSYKHIVELIEIGRSLQNRSLIVMKIGYPQNVTKKLFWFDSGIHSREWTSISTALYSIDKILIEQVNKNSLMSKFLKSYDIYFLIVVNPDGYQYSLEQDFLWRKNLRNSSEDCFGVDLNRNFDYHWMRTGSSDDICSDIYAGVSPGSEPETKSIKDFILSKTWVSFVTIHSYGAYWLHHWETNEKLTKNSYLKICGKASYAIRAVKKNFDYEYKFGVPIQLLSYEAGGASDTWAMMVANIPYSYTLEVGPTEYETLNKDFYFGFHVSESKIEFVVKRAFMGLREYMKTFMFKINRDIQNEIDKNCLVQFELLKKNF